MRVEFLVLGPLEVVADGSVVPVPAGRGRVLLATLLLRANRFVSVDELIERLWEGAPPSPDRAKTTLQMVVTRLRQALGEANCVRTMTGGYIADVGVDQLDLSRFRTLVSTGTLAEALRLWRGPVLGNVVSESLHRDDVPPLLDERLVALERRVDADLDGGVSAELVPELQSLTQQHPLRERFWGQLMRALYASGRQAEALEAYQEVRRTLVAELGIEPGEQLRHLHGELLRQYEPTAPGRRYLPRDLPDFTGRSNDLAALLTPAKSGVCTIDGMAGVGKTALAVHAAHRLAEAYPDAQLFVDLHGYTVGHEPAHPVDVLNVLLRSLGVATERIPAGLEERAALWRAELVNLRVIVVLDNAFDTAQVRPLLPAEPGCLVLVTSRRRLVGLDGGQPLSLDVLPSDTAIELFGRIVGAQRVEAEPEVVAELADMCGHLPLAIRVAAARLKHRPSWTADHLAKRLRDERGRLSELTVDDRNAETAFALSYRGLSNEQQWIFRCLGIHFGDRIDAYSCAALTGLDFAVVARELESLVDVHLVEESEPGSYRLHDLVRQFARQLAETTDSDAERDSASGRLLDYYLHIEAFRVTGCGVV